MIIPVLKKVDDQLHPCFTEVDEQVRPLLFAGTEASPFELWYCCCFYCIRSWNVEWDDILKDWFDYEPLDESFECVNPLPTHFWQGAGCPEGTHYVPETGSFQGELGRASEIVGAGCPELTWGHPFGCVGTPCEAEEEI